MMGATSANSCSIDVCRHGSLASGNGAGDLASQNVSGHGRGVHGRLDAYTTAIDKDREALAEALERNLLRGADSPDARQSDWLTMYWPCRRRSRLLMRKRCWMANSSLAASRRHGN